MDKQKIIDKMKDAVLDRCKERIERAKKDKKPKVTQYEAPRGMTSGLRGRYGL